MHNLVLSRKLKQFGVKLQLTEYLVLYSLTKWIKLVQTSFTLLELCMTVYKRMLIQFSFQSVLKMNSKESLILVEMKAFFYEDDLGTRAEAREIPEEYKDQAEEYRDKLIEAVAELDEELNDEIP